MKIKVKIINLSNERIQLTGYLELNGVELVNCDTRTIDICMEVSQKDSILEWKRIKNDPMMSATYKLKFKGDGTDDLMIQNAPSFEGVKVLLNGKNISGEYQSDH